MSPEEYLSQFPERVRETMTALRTLVREAAPDAAERVIPGWNILAYEYAGIFCYIGPHKDRAALGFNQGARLPDPQGLLASASGAQAARNVYVSAAADIDQAAVRELVQAAFVFQVMRAERKKTLRLR